MGWLGKFQLGEKLTFPDAKPASNTAPFVVRHEDFVRKRFTEKDDHGAEAWANGRDGRFPSGLKQAQLPTVACLPVLVQVKNR